MSAKSPSAQRIALSTGTEIPHGALCTCPFSRFSTVQSGAGKSVSSHARRAWATSFYLSGRFRVSAVSQTRVWDMGVSMMLAAWLCAPYSVSYSTFSKHHTEGRKDGTQDGAYQPAEFRPRCNAGAPGLPRTAKTSIATSSSPPDSSRTKWSQPSNSGSASFPIS